jgi:hypothetical protein
MAHRAGIRWHHARWIDERRLLPSASRSSGNGAHARRKRQPGQSVRWPVGSSNCGHDKHDDNPASELFRVKEFCPPSGLNGLRDKGKNHGKYCGEMFFCVFAAPCSRRGRVCGRRVLHFTHLAEFSVAQPSNSVTPDTAGPVSAAWCDRGPLRLATECWPHSAADGPPVRPD